MVAALAEGPQAEAVAEEEPGGSALELAEAASAEQTVQLAEAAVENPQSDCVL